MLLTGKGIAGFSRQDMFKQPSGVGVHMTERVFCLEPCHGLLPGLGMLQNLPSAVVAHVLNPAPGSRVLDMCASPGGGFNLFVSKHTLAHVFYLVVGSCLLQMHASPKRDLNRYLFVNQQAAPAAACAVHVLIIPRNLCVLDQFAFSLEVLSCRHCICMLFGASERFSGHHYHAFTVPASSTVKMITRSTDMEHIVDKI